MVTGTGWLGLGTIGGKIFRVITLGNFYTTGPIHEEGEKTTESKEEKFESLFLIF